MSEQMTVAGLIAALQRLDPALPVKADGCSQCVNPVTGVQVVTLPDATEAWIEVEI